MVQFLRTTIIGGVVFLVPVIILIEIIGAALKLTNELVSPLANYIHVEAIGDIAILNLLAIVVLVLVCFLAGLVASSTLANWLIETLEGKILTRQCCCSAYNMKPATRSIIQKAARLPTR